jgi:hypothetical protein
MRRTAHALAPLLLASGLGAQAAPPGPAADVTAVADAFVAAFLERNPEYGTILWLPAARHDLAVDPSPAALRAWEATVDGFLETTLGERFDLRAFHDEVLGDGAVTLPMLRDKVERWVAARLAGP